MSTRHERLSSAFSFIRTNILNGQDAQAFSMLERIVEAELKKRRKKNGSQVGN